MPGDSDFGIVLLSRLEEFLGVMTQDVGSLEGLYEQKAAANEIK